MEPPEINCRIRKRFRRKSTWKPVTSGKQPDKRNIRTSVIECFKKTKDAAKSSREQKESEAAKEEAVLKTRLKMQPDRQHR
ncbi:MAG: hypothetical protein ACLTTO_15155 [Lachnospiraceae bacterium]